MFAVQLFFNRKRKNIPGRKRRSCSRGLRSDRCCRKSGDSRPRGRPLPYRTLGNRQFRGNGRKWKYQSSSSRTPRNWRSEMEWRHLRRCSSSRRYYGRYRPRKFQYYRRNVHSRKNRRKKSRLPRHLSGNLHEDGPRWKPKSQLRQEEHGTKNENDECCHYEGTTLPSEGIL